MEDAFIGWDIGGAHLKMAHIDHDGKVITAQQIASPLWEGLQTLEHALAEAKNYWPNNLLHHSVTTTAELSDIFKDRYTGVLNLRDRLSVFLGDSKYYFYAGDAGLIPAEQTDNYISRIASANWHATASYVAQQIEYGILIDIGSTTTDLVPFDSGKLNYCGYSDYERMSKSELVYTGIIRTPIMAVVERVPCEGEWHTIASEHFATIADVYRLTGELNIRDDLLISSDGEGKELIDCARRLARMLGTDVNDDDYLDKWQLTARYIAEQHLQHIQQALFRVLSRGKLLSDITIVGAGVGRFLAQKIASRNSLRYTDFSDLFEADNNIKGEATKCAAAVAVAQIMRCSI